LVTRISNPILVNTALRNMQTALRNLQETQEILSTGLTIRRPSDNPLGAATAVRLRAEILEMDRYVTNIDEAESFITATEGALGSINDILIDLREIALTEANAVGDEQSRAAAAKQVDALIEQLIQVSNSDFGGRYLFAGHKTETIPFARGEFGAIYRGDAGLIFEEIGPGNVIPINIPGNSAFATEFGQVIGDTDLNPDIGLSLGTSLDVLNLGGGVDAGRIVITDGSGATAAVDLTEATTIGNVITAITTTEGISVDARINNEGNGLLITDTSGGAGSLQIVEDPLASPPTTTAADLGILGSSVGSIAGTDILNFDVPLVQLNGGIGVQLGNIVITDGNGVSTTVNLGGTTTISAVINAINLAGGGNFYASINFDGHGLKVTDTTGGGNPLTITEDPMSTSTTAADLGILGSGMGSVTGTDLDPTIEAPTVSASTLLADLNYGSGVDVLTGTFDITDRDGNTATVDVSAAVDVGDLLAAINGAGINVTASIASDGSGIELTDTVSTGRSQITVEETTGTTAFDLGLLGTGQGSTLHGARLDPITTSSTPVQLLAGGVGISLGTIQIQNGNLSASVDLSGAVTVGNVLAAIERAGVRVDASVDSAGRRIIIDSQTGSDTPIIIVSERGATSEDLGLFSPGLFETAEAVRQALLDNDPERSSQLVANIDDSISSTIDARTNAGQQIVQLSFARTRLKGVQLSFEGLRSKTEEADLTEFATTLVNQQTIYEAALATTVHVIQSTLFSFL